jgi:hypothetical protein
MVREWTRQAARATGVSLLAPVVLLLAAAAVASGGALGGFGALGQLAGGPDLPDLGTPVAASETLADAEIVGADTSEPAVTSGAVAGDGSGSLASAPGGAGDGAPGADGPVAVGPLPPAGAFDTPSAAPQAPAAPAPPPADGLPPAADPVEEIIDTTRGVGESLPGPLGPTTGDILDLLLPPE